jgi:hypothetical protein
MSKGSIIDEAQNFIFRHHSNTSSWAQLSSYSVGKVKNEWRCASTSVILYNVAFKHSYKFTDVHCYTQICVAFVTNFTHSHEM